MKILLLSDLHGHLPKLPTGWDLVLIAGDLCPDWVGAENGMRQAIWMNNTFEPWMPRECYFTWGNHDRVGMDCPDWLTERVRVRAKVDELVEVDGKRIWFCPWTNKFGWTSAFMKHPLALLPYFEMIPEGLDILVSHGPPFGVLDTVQVGAEHLGSKGLSSALDRAQPKMMVCGHIHGGYGQGVIHHYGAEGSVEEHKIVKVGETKVYNVALMNEAYRPVNAPVMIDV